MSDSKPDFVCRCEGDLERISKVFVSWLKENNVNTNKMYSIRVPNEMWAALFVSVYTDEIERNDLADIAEKNIIQIVFQVETSILDIDVEELEAMSDEELLDLLEDLTDMDDDDDSPEGAD